MLGIVIAFVGGIGQSVAWIVVGIACDDGYRVVAEVGVEQGGVGGEAAVGIGVMVDGVVECSHIPFVDGVGFEVGDGDEFMVGMAALERLVASGGTVVDGVGAGIAVPGQRGGGVGDTGVSEPGGTGEVGVGEFDGGAGLGDIVDGEGVVGVVAAEPGIVVGGWGELGAVALGREEGFGDMARFLGAVGIGTE